jgi:hypothetical protein
VTADPDAAWPRFALGALYFRRLWRPDCLKQWEFAFTRDPTLVDDPQLAPHLCHMLDPRWLEAGVMRFLATLGPRATPILERCASSAADPLGRARAERAVERLARR